MRAPVATALAIITALIILLGYFIPIPLFTNLRALFLGWAVVLAAVAALIAILNLVFGVHWNKMRGLPDGKRDLYSPFLILSFLLTAGVGFASGPSSPAFQQLVINIQVPVEASLMAVLAVSLGYASLRLLQRRKGLMGIVFVISSIVFLVMLSGFLSIGSSVPVLRELFSAIQVLPLAGARGILLGVSLGALTTGLRILIGADRPYSG